MTENANPPPPAFRRTVCPACGYALVGLPAAGRCPECGTAYRSDEVILYGWACGSRASVENSRGLTLVWKLVGPTAWLLFPWMILLPATSTPLASAAKVAVGVLWLWSLGRGLVRLVRPGPAATGTPGPVQVRMGDDGFGQFDTTGSKEPAGLDRGYANWYAARWCQWGPTRADRYRLRIDVRPLRWGRVSWVDAEVRCAAADVPQVTAALVRWTAHLSTRRPPGRAAEARGALERV